MALASPSVVPVQTRSERPSSTDVTDFPAVTGREFEWKFAPLDRIRPLIEGVLDGSPVAFQYSESAGTTVEWVDRATAVVGVAGTPEDRASANAWGAVEKVLQIRVTSEEAEELLVRREHFDQNPRAAHVVIEALPNSSGTVILEHRGDADLSENVEIVVGEGAQLTVVTVQEWNDSAVHVSSHFATVGRDANLRHVIVSLGGGVVRVNPSIHLAGQGSSTDAFGLYFADAGQYLEQRPYIDHQAANTRSRVNYKGALQGAKAHTVWVGDVLIGPHADGTDSYEQNRNLVLSDGTRADSIPNLEIETGNIVGAGHASSTGRFDDEQLFYLQSRGISEEEARRLVVRGFLAEIITQIGSPALEERLTAAVEAELVEAEVVRAAAGVASDAAAAASADAAAAGAAS
ncbi:Fe-S cluster assembly protein SufD [Herbiconiux sp. VKM Ac-1786]|nr:Fe-S cluster assembly protein SufD [Herbiconiux sp. VKM Ac-1786]MBF4573558.1 Fe-S cluster assembly protein SufD [Herbiconiux sp. VKM Ac-1786]